MACARYSSPRFLRTLWRPHLHLRLPLSFDFFFLVRGPHRHPSALLESSGLRPLSALHLFQLHPISAELDHSLPLRHVLSRVAPAILEHPIFRRKLTQSAFITIRMRSSSYIPSRECVSTSASTARIISSGVRSRTPATSSASRWRLNSVPTGSIASVIPSVQATSRSPGPSATAPHSNCTSGSSPTIIPPTSSHSTRPSARITAGGTCPAVT